MKATNLQKVFLVIRPISRLRGAYRVLRYINKLLLDAGLDPIQVCKLRDGTFIRVDLRSKTEWWTFYSGYYDDDIMNFAREILKRVGGDFLDVGGNIGMYAVRLACSLKPDQNCLVFEPVPSNAQRIQENAELNLVEARLKIYQEALSDTSGNVEMILREDFERGSRTGNASVAISEAADGQMKRITAQKYRFDDKWTLESERPVYLAKVDIEGHEDYFLRGAESWMRSMRPILLIEINNWFYEKRGTSSSECFAKALPSDYKVAVLRRHKGRVSLYPCEMENLQEFKSLENCVLYPPEKGDIINDAANAVSTPTTE